jgi:hypothetical protein
MLMSLFFQSSRSLRSQSIRASTHADVAVLPVKPCSISAPRPPIFLTLKPLTPFVVLTLISSLHSPRSLEKPLATLTLSNDENRITFDSTRPGLSPIDRYLSALHISPWRSWYSSHSSSISIAPSHSPSSSCQPHLLMRHLESLAADRMTFRSNSYLLVCSSRILRLKPSSTTCSFRGLLMVCAFS